MDNRQEYSIEEENKNLSDGLRDLINQANSYANTAAQIIIEAYKYAVHIDMMTPLGAGEVLKRELDYSPQWINKQLPEEAKHTQMKRLVNRGPIVKRVSQNIQEIPKEVENITIPHKADIILEAQSIPPETEDFFIPPDRFRKVFMGLMKFRQTGEQTGVYITRNWDIR